MTHRYSHNKNINNNNGNYKPWGRDPSFKSVIEYYLSTGRIPQYFPNLSSNGIPENGRQEKHLQRGEKKKNVSREYVEFDKIIEGTDVKVKDRIQKIESIRMDISKEHFSKFENLSKNNGWDDNQMGLIYFSLIMDEQEALKLPNDSYKSLKTALLNIRSPIFPHFIKSELANK